MNLVIDDAIEIKLATKTTEESRIQLGRRQLLGVNQCTNDASGQILLKGDNVSLIQAVQ